MRKHTKFFYVSLLLTLLNGGWWVTRGSYWYLVGAFIWSYIVWDEYGKVPS